MDWRGTLAVFACTDPLTAMPIEATPVGFSEMAQSPTLSAWRNHRTTADAVEASKLPSRSGAESRLTHA